MRFDLQTHRPVVLDAPRVSTIVGNLVANAVTHGRPPLAVGVQNVGAQVRIVVSDAGDGVPASARDRVFDRFVQADDSRHGPGSGLGLAIARGNARLLGGDIRPDADNRTFAVRLPRDLQPAQQRE